MADIIGYEPNVAAGVANQRIPQTFVDQGDGTYAKKVAAVITTSDIEIGAVELKDGTTDTRAKIGAGTGLVEGDNAVAVRDPRVVTSLGTLLTQTDGLEASASSIDTKLTSQATAAKQDTGNTSAATIATQTAPLLNFGAGEYETVAASQTAQVLGASGAAGDYLAGILVIPAVVACGLVTVLDGATSIPVFVGGGTTALPSCIPFFIPLGLKAVGAGWSITTGASVSVIACGNFT